MRHLPSHCLPILVLLALFAALLALTAGCGGDSTPVRTPTATQPPPTAAPIPTPEPTPTPTPVPPTPTPTPDTPQPTGSMLDFVIDESSTGKDLMDRLSTEETDCVRAAFGEVFYGILLAAPLLQGGSAEGTATLVGCLEPENVVLFVVAVDDALAGGRSEDTRMCITDLSLERPEMAYIQVGVEWKGEETPRSSGRHSFILDY